MSSNPVLPMLEATPAGESTLFDSLASLVPEELQSAYYRVLAHTRTLSPNDEMLRVLEAMGILALLTRQAPLEIAEERERFRNLLEIHQHVFEETQQKTVEYIRKLEAQIADLPQGIEAGLDPKRIATLLGESLRQNFSQSGLHETANALRTTTASMTESQRQLSVLLVKIVEPSNGILARTESLFHRLERSVVERTKSLDELVHEWKKDMLRLWIPLVAGSALLLGIFLGMEARGSLESSSKSATPTIQIPADSPNESTPPQHSNQGHISSRAQHER